MKLKRLVSFAHSTKLRMIFSAELAISLNFLKPQILTTNGKKAMNDLIQFAGRLIGVLSFVHCAHTRERTSHKNKKTQSDLSEAE